SNLRNIAESRSPSSVAVRSSKKVAGPRAHARACRACSNWRSNILGPDDIALSFCDWRSSHAKALPCYGSSMNELVSARPDGLQSLMVGFRDNLRSVLRLVFNFALPPLCPCCREPLGEGMGLCASCWSTLSLIEPPYCARLGIPFSYDPGAGLLSMEA